MTHTTARTCDTQPPTVVPPGAHDWSDYMGRCCCRQCGMVRRRDGKNKPCKGAAKISRRSEP
jgi:hypothetical protein